MQSLKISDIASVCGGSFTKDGTVNGICIDNRSVKKDNLFIAIKGDSKDGHDFAPAAVKAGAGAVMCHRSIECQCPKVLVKDTKKSLSELAKWYRRRFNIPVIAITGSVGKTTTKEMVWAVSSTKFNTLKNEGNLNNRIGMPLSVLKLGDEHQAAVFEMGVELPDDIRQMSKIAFPDIGIVSNIGVSHIENFGSRENILKAKMEIVDGIKSGGVLLLNRDDDMLKNVKVESHRVIYYAVSEKADYTAENIVSIGEETQFDAVFEGGRQHIILPTIGEHNVKNALAAFAVGILLGISPEMAAEGLKNYVPSGMRQRIVHKNGIVFIEDCYNASPDSMKAALSAISHIDAKRRILVLGDMLELGEFSEKMHYEVGKLAAQSGAEMIFAFGKNAEQYVNASKEFNVEAKLFDDKSKLSEELFGLIESGDAVLFKASRGMKLEEVIHSIYDRWENK